MIPDWQEVDAGDLNTFNDKISLDYEVYNTGIGPVVIGDTVKGLYDTTWVVYFTEDDETIYIKTLDDQSSAVLLVSGLGVTELAVTFDQNANPVISYIQDGSLKLRWYDPILADYVISDFGDAQSSTVYLDMNYIPESSDSDIILNYIREGAIFTRLQRDKYAIEYTTPVTEGAIHIYNAGLRKDYRFQVEYSVTHDMKVSFDHETAFGEVTFTDTSTTSVGVINAWSWSFGDGATSSEQNPVHEYMSKGDYNVSLTATASNGASLTTTKLVVILEVDIPPTAIISWEHTAQKEIQLTSESLAGQGTITDYLWDFGDGTTSTDQNPIKLYSNFETRTVTLTVTNSQGLTDTATDTISFAEILPDCDFSWEYSTGTYLLFTDESVGRSSDIVKWVWTFDDGLTSLTQHPRHNYSGGDGLYTVRLTVEDTYGQTSFTEKQVETFGALGVTISSPQGQNQTCETT